MPRSFRKTAFLLGIVSPRLEGNQEILKPPLGHMMDAVGAAPVGELAGALAHLEDDRFGRLAQGDDQEDLEMIRDAEGAAE